MAAALQRIPSPLDSSMVRPSPFPWKKRSLSALETTNTELKLIANAPIIGLSFKPGVGPQFAHPVQSEEAVDALYVPDPEEKLRYVTDAVRTIRRELNNRVPLIGFSGSPFTLACYMVEGGSSKDFSTIKKMMYARPDLIARILDVNARAVTEYLNAQIKAGAQAVQIFDTWGGTLSESSFKEFSLAYMQKIIDGLHKTYDGERIPVIVFTKGGGQWLESIATCGTDAVGLDWTSNLSQARRRVKDSVALQGNLDPMVLFGSEDRIRQEVRRVIEDFGVVHGGGHVFNLGHGINQFTPPEAVEILVDEVHRYSPAFHKA